MQQMQLLQPKMDQTQWQSVEHGWKLLARIPKPYIVSKHIQSWTTFRKLLKMFGESQAPISWYFHMHWSTSAFGNPLSWVFKYDCTISQTEKLKHNLGILLWGHNLQTQVKGPHLLKAVWFAEAYHLQESKMNNSSYL